ncbi:MAG: hypothetical protein ACOX45_09335 [Acutalibacteraceae bacterium]
MTPASLAEIISVVHQCPLVSISAAGLDPKAMRLVPERLAKTRCCIPRQVLGKELVLVMENPGNLLVIEDIERLTGLRVTPNVAPRDQILKAIDAFYTAEPESGSPY